MLRLDDEPSAFGDEPDRRYGPPYGIIWGALVGFAFYGLLYLIFY